ncbi:hypothetical protein [Streptomyces termitum]|uniref:hypothetical protein n=1 Tax=Streptomyces termitum TaxID=67368 RepID=UPI0033BF368B
MEPTAPDPDPADLRRNTPAPPAPTPRDRSPAGWRKFLDLWFEEWENSRPTPPPHDREHP